MFRGSGVYVYFGLRVVYYCSAGGHLRINSDIPIDIGLRKNDQNRGLIWLTDFNCRARNNRLPIGDGPIIRKIWPWLAFLKYICYFNDFFAAGFPAVAGVPAILQAFLLFLAFLLCCMTFLYFCEHPCSCWFPDCCRHPCCLAFWIWSLRLLASLHLLVLFIDLLLLQVSLPLQAFLLCLHACLRSCCLFWWVPSAVVSLILFTSLPLLASLLFLTSLLLLTFIIFLFALKSGSLNDSVDIKNFCKCRWSCWRPYWWNTLTNADIFLASLLMLAGFSSVVLCSRYSHVAGPLLPVCIPVVASVSAIARTIAVFDPIDSDISNFNCCLFVLKN